MSVAFFERLDAAGAPRDLVALGGTLDAATLVAAYRAGCFPWPPPGPRERALARTGRVPVLAGPDGLVPWVCPDPRAVLLPHLLVVPRSLRARLRNSGWHCTLDTAFTEVVAACADRAETWITRRVQEAYAELHGVGGAHSVEVWEGDELVGGLYGVLTGGVFSGESMFHRRTDASKVALVDLVLRLAEAGVRVLDTQQATEHMARLGQVLVTRPDYLGAVRALRDQQVLLPDTPRPSAELPGLLTLLAAAS